MGFFMRIQPTPLTNPICGGFALLKSQISLRGVIWGQIRLGFEHVTHKANWWIDASEHYEIGPIMAMEKLHN